MKAKHAVAISLLMFALALAGCSKDRSTNNLPTAPTSTASETADARVVFTTAQSPEAIMGFAAQNGLTVTTVEHSIPMGADNATGFLPLYPHDNAATLRTRWAGAYQAFLTSGAALSLQQVAVPRDPSAMSAAVRLKTQFTNASAQQHQLAATAIQLSGPKEAIQKLQGTNEVVGDVQYRVSEDEIRSAHPNSAMSVQAVDPSTWVPRVGRIISKPSPYYSGQREAWNYMIWGNKSGFASGYEYEHDFYLDNQDGALYLDGRSDIYGFPSYEYAVTNLPAAYLDSRFSDPSWLRQYTLGCANGSAIVTEKQYYTYWRTRNGNASTDRAGLTAQLTHHFRCSADVTWCMYQVDGTPNYPLVSGWKIPLPGDYSWWR